MYFRKLSDSPQEKQFVRKLAAYVLAGAAILIPGTAEAGTIDYFPNVDTIVTGPGLGSSYSFNLSGPSSADLTLEMPPGVVGSDPAVEIGIETANGAEVVFGGVNNVSALSEGAAIGPADRFGTLGELVAYDQRDGDIAGFWPSNGGDAYLGFYFEGPDGPQYGWADITTLVSNSTATFEVLDYAYSTVTNATIFAGQTQDTPEPSTIALLALGAAGMVAMRRRLSANS